MVQLQNTQSVCTAGTSLEIRHFRAFLLHGGSPASLAACKSRFRDWLSERRIADRAAKLNRWLHRWLSSRLSA
jgi:hypothetical protein